MSSAFAISKRWPRVQIDLYEKEKSVAAHQSGRNSGVIHSGIYYTPGSLKAELCREGRKKLVEFCIEQHIRIETCGKIIVATTDSQVPRLKAIYERGKENRVRCELLSGREIQDYEPHAVGVKAIFVPDAGIVDFRAVAIALKKIVQDSGHTILLGAEVSSLRQGSGRAHLAWGANERAYDLVINCAGLHSDRIARMAGVDPEMQIVPFRGVYYELREEARRFCNHLIYPVPDPAYPFLGVHFTRMIDGRIEVGPNAVLATGREGYRLSSIHFGDMLEALRYSGFRHLARANFRMGIKEMHRTISRRAYAKAVQALVPQITAEDLIPCRSGIRAQALRADGSMVDDFVIIEQPNIVHVCNAPSPAATACLSIGEFISERVANRLD